MSFDMIISNQNMIKSKIVLYGYRHFDFIAYIKTEDIYKDIEEDVEARHFKIWIR